MKDNLSEIVFILDRSGSMEHLEEDTIGGFNSFIKTQKSEPGDAKVTVVLFDDQYQILYNGVDLQKVPVLTREEYYARGMTALLDAVGKTIKEVGKRLAQTPEEERPSQVIVVITTDGMENASRHFSYIEIKRMIEHQQEKYNWKFIFLGANIDAVAVGESIGTQYSSNYVPNASGTQAMYKSVTRSVSTLRKGEELEDDWNEDLNEAL